MRVKAVYTALRLMADVVLVNAAIAFAFWVRFEAGWLTYQERHYLRDYVPLFLLETVLVPLVFAFSGLYRFQRQSSALEELMRVFAGTSAATVMSMAASAFVSRDFVYSRLVLSLGWGLGVLLVWLARRLLLGALRGLWRQGRLRDRALLVGEGELARAMVQRIQRSPELGYDLIGVVTEVHPPGSWVEGIPVLGPPSALRRLIQEHAATQVFIADPGLTHDQLLSLVAQCPLGRVGIHVLPDDFQIMSSGVSFDELGTLPLVVVRDVALRGWNLVIKRAMDLVISATALVLLSPLMLLIALLIKITSPNGPVFYIQERVGLDDKPFLILKFRSMRADAEQATGPVWATEGDPRRTRLGALLRRWSLDELPQLINVLIGEMSLVGPRPERPVFVEQFRQRIPAYAERHREKAGLTGWAQVNGLRGNVSIEERTAYDLWYVENWTPWLDIKIMLRTLAAVFRGDNAY